MTMKIPDMPAIVHVLHSLEGGGTERTLVALLSAPEGSRFAHTVVPLRQPGSLCADLPDNVACRPIGASGRTFRSGVKLAGIVRRLGAGIIHARNTGSWFDATVAHLLCPDTHLVLGFHGLETADGFNSFRVFKARLALRAGARFTTVSESGRRRLEDQAGIQPELITVLPNGIDLRRFGGKASGLRDEVRRELQLDDDDHVVGTVGSLTPVKRHDLLIDAIAALASREAGWRLLIVGEGPLRRQLERRVVDLGIHRHVRFTGMRHDVPRLLACMDMYACTSSSEEMSNAILEAMAAGLPIVATDVGDNAAVVRDGVEGRIIPAQGLDDLTHALRELAASPELRQRLSGAAAARAEEFDFRRTVLAYDAYYRTLADVKPSRRRGPGLASLGFCTLCGCLQGLE